MTCSRCGKSTTGSYHAWERCSCEPRRTRTMSREQRIAELTDEGVLDAVERMTGVRDVQVRSEDRVKHTGPEAGLGPMARRARAAQRAAGYDPDEED